MALTQSDLITAMQASGYSAREVDELTAFAKSQGWTVPLDPDAEHDRYCDWKAEVYYQEII